MQLCTLAPPMVRCRPTANPPFCKQEHGAALPSAQPIITMPIQDTLPVFLWPKFAFSVVIPYSSFVEDKFNDMASHTQFIENRSISYHSIPSWKAAAERLLSYWTIKWILQENKYLCSQISVSWEEAIYDQLLLKFEGQTMEVLYEAMAGQVFGLGTSHSEDTKRAIELENLIVKGKKQVDSLQRQIKGERQLNRQMELNGEVRTLKRQIAQWQNELQETKFVNSDKKYTTQWTIETIRRNITMERPERLGLQSADGVQLNLDALYQIAPSCFTEAPDPKTGG